jgi:hypothetical protein
MWMRIVANIALLTGLVIFAGFLWIEVESAKSGCATAKMHFGVQRCDDNLVAFSWPILGFATVATAAGFYEFSGGRRTYLVLAAAAFLLFGLLSLLSALMLVGAAALAQAALA